MQKPSAELLHMWHSIFELGPESIRGVGLNYPIPHLRANELLALCENATEILKSQEVLVEIPHGTYVIGDIHGNIHDLLRILHRTGLPPNCHLLFLGDYVDRGTYSTEVISLLLSLLVEYPDHVVLLRGNHEFAKINSQYGFKAELDSAYHSDSDAVHAAVNNVFNWLPFSAIVQGTTLCVHGGISPRINGIAHLKSIPRPLDSYKGIVSDLVWSDPAPPGFSSGPNLRGQGYMFCEMITAKFLDANGLKMLIRSHQCVSPGIVLLHQNRTCTVFSSSNYSRDDRGKPNAAAILEINSEGKMQAFPFPPVCNWPLRHDVKFRKQRQVLMNQQVRAFKLDMDDHSPLRMAQKKRRRESFRLRMTGSVLGARCKPETDPRNSMKPGQLPPLPGHDSQMQRASSELL